MGDNPNAEALRKGYAAFAAGDMATVSSLFADGIAWHQAGNGPLSGDSVGKDAVFGVFAKLTELTAGTFRQQIHDLLADDEHAVVLVEQWWEQPHPFRGKSVHVWHMKDGIANEAWLTDQEQAAADAALTP
ncbi:MAG: nuclear transport factor 2 family protein [Actinomycetota bacterium]